MLAGASADSTFTIARAQTAQGYELFYSAQTGYFTFWNPLVYTIEDQSSGSDGDWIRLYDEQDGITAEFFAFLAPALKTKDCVSTILDQLAAAPSTVDIEDLSEEGGPPQVSQIDLYSYDASSSVVVLTTRGDDGPAKFAVQVGCRQIVPGASMLARTLQIPASVYNMNGLDLVWQELDVGLFDQLTREDRPQPIPDASGQVTGTIAAVQNCLAFPLFGLARGTSASDDLVVDPSAFNAVGFGGQALPFTVIWSLPAAEPTAPVVLGKGEFALFQIVEDDPDDDITDLYYNAPGATPIQLSHFEDGCGAGGGAPVLIDVD
jgi:hypothetical protein